MMIKIRIFIVISTFFLSINGVGQTRILPVVTRNINSYLDTLLKDEEINAKDTLLLSSDFNIDTSFLQVSSFKIMKNYPPQGDYYILRYHFQEIIDNTIKIRIELNDIKFSRSSNGAETEEINGPYEDYWIMYDCAKKEWVNLKQ